MLSREERNAFDPLKWAIRQQKKHEDLAEKWEIVVNQLHRMDELDH